MRILSRDRFLPQGEELPEFACGELGRAARAVADHPIDSETIFQVPPPIPGAVWRPASELTSLASRPSHSERFSVFRGMPVRSRGFRMTRVEDDRAGATTTAK